MNNQSLNTLSDRLLSIIRQKREHFYRIDRLKKRLDHDVMNIYSAVKVLKENGYDIRRDRDGNIAFFKAPDRLLETEIALGLKTSFVGKRIYAYQTVQSTNAIAARLAGSDTDGARIPEGALIVAESQTAGRGRFGRNWMSLPERGIYLSIILYPKLAPQDAPGLSIMTALSLADTLRPMVKTKVQIKWPNDCLIAGKKVAGILTELTGEIGHVHHVVVGVGINVNHTHRSFPTDIAEKATSVRIQNRKRVSRVELLQKFLRNFEKDYKHFTKSGLKQFRKRILKYSNLIGHEITLDFRGDVITGKALDIDNRGCLVMDIDGATHTFSAGEVTVVKK